ncbi:hypothetical protein COLO4_00913, partial [Corchorus olitorius]
LEAKTDQKHARSLFENPGNRRIGAHALGQMRGQQHHDQAIEKGQSSHRGRHHREREQALVACGIHEQREEGHVEHDGLGVHQGDQAGLAKVVARLDVQHGLVAGPGCEHPETQPAQVGGAQPLHGMEGRGIGSQQRGNARHRHPDQHLVGRQHAGAGRHSGAYAALAGGGDQRQIARPRNQQKQKNGNNECAEIGDAEHADP